MDAVAAYAAACAARRLFLADKANALPADVLFVKQVVNACLELEAAGQLVMGQQVEYLVGAVVVEVVVGNAGHAGLHIGGGVAAFFTFAKQ